MKDPILQTVRYFLKGRELKGKSLLLGLSGGPDSLALLHLLVACQEEFGFCLNAVHIDHGWREESALESQLVEEWVKGVGIPLHLYRLSAPQSRQNLEEKARQERFSVFEKVYQDLRADALVLAHQSDDQSETVLKRIFEGAHLFSMGGLRSESNRYGMSVWRPLLKISKENIVKWLKMKGLKWIDDPSNRDEVFLRARMRGQIMPYLNEVFGKQVGNNLHSLAENAHLLKEYFSRRLTPYFEQYNRLEDGGILDLSLLYPVEALELKAFFDHENIRIARGAFENLMHLIGRRASSKVIISKAWIISLRKGFLEIKKNCVTLSPGGEKF